MAGGREGGSRCACGQQLPAHGAAAVGGPHFFAYESRGGCSRSEGSIGLASGVRPAFRLSAVAAETSYPQAHWVLVGINVPDGGRNVRSA